MTRVVAFDDVKKDQFRLKGCALNTPFMTSSGDASRQPVAFLSQGDPARHIHPHWHSVDQFQVIAEGHGMLGRHEIAPYCVHFTRAFTPYGPLVDDGKGGVSFFTLRARLDGGPNYFPESAARLKAMPGRQPWQISRQVRFPSQEGRAISAPVELREVPDIKNDHGLFASALTLIPDARAVAPDPSGGDGQYVIAVKGSLWHEHKEHEAFTVIFVEPQDGPFKLHAGAEGLEALVLNFPQKTARAPTKIAPRAIPGSKKWQCELCAFAYDEAIGLPDDGLPPGTRWQDVPDSWSCPDCGTSKSDFKMVETH